MYEQEDGPSRQKFADQENELIRLRDQSQANTCLIKELESKIESKEKLLLSHVQ